MSSEALILYTVCYYLAQQAGHKNLMKYISDQNITINDKQNNKFSALFVAAEEGQLDKFETCFKDCNLILENKIGKIPDVSAENKDNIDFLYDKGRTALSIAAEHGLDHLVQIVINMGANVNITDASGWSSIHYAAKKGNEIILNILLKKGVDINLMTVRRETPLLLASRYGNDKIVKLLLSKGANINIIDANRYNAMQHAAFNGHGQIILMFLKKGINFTDILSMIDAACCGGKKNILDIIFKKEPNLEFKNWSPLHSAVKNGHTTIVEMLLKKGIDIDVQNDKKRTSLFVAAFCGEKEMVKILLDKGANINITDSCGWSVLHYAAQRGHIEIVKLFLESGIDINIQTINTGQTPLSKAAEFGHVELVKLLLKRGANKKVKDNFGHTAKHHATKNNHQSIAELLNGLSFKQMTITRRK